MLSKTLEVGTRSSGHRSFRCLRPARELMVSKPRVKPEERILVHIPSPSLTSSEPSGKSIKLSEFLFLPMSGSGRIA